MLLVNLVEAILLEDGQQQTLSAQETDAQVTIEEKEIHHLLLFY